MMDSVSFFDETRDILKVCGDWVALNKPHGLHVLPDRYDSSIPTVREYLDGRYGELFIVHRLDSGTGGILLLARNKAAHRHLCAQFERGSVYKAYTALVRGCFPVPVSIMLPMAAKNSRGRYKINFKSGRRALTSFYPEMHNDRASIVKAELHTGRTHQIRVHLKAHGHPLIQDFLYGEKNTDKKLTLFASETVFTNTDNGEVRIEAPLSIFMKKMSAVFGLTKV
jgi:RluA family pseudouridine synthase